MRAVIYVRQSQDRRGDELGVTRQRNACEKLCHYRGWTVADTITDNDVSASSRKPRPGFARLLKMLDAHEMDVVVVYHVDRLVRKMRDLEDVIDKCEETGIPVVTASGDLDMSTDAGRLNARILASVARAEVERKGARQRMANEQAAAQGRRVGGRRPFGYEQDGVTLIPREAEAVRDAYTMFLSGVSLGEIARSWNEQSLHSGQGAWREDRRGQPTGWTNSTVRRLLLNPRYAGLRRHNGEIIGKAEWPAIVPEETWQAVKALLSEPSRRRTPRGGRRLLTGIARCAVCDQLIHGGGASHKKPIYRCRSGLHISRLSDPVDHWVGLVVVARLSRRDAVELLVDHDRPDIDALREKAQVVRARLQSLEDEFAEDDDMSPVQLRSINSKLKGRLAELERQMADAGKADLLEPLITSSDVHATWFGAEDDDSDDGLPLDRKRAIVDAVAEVRLHPVGVGTRTFRPETVKVTLRS